MRGLKVEAVARAECKQAECALDTAEEGIFIELSHFVVAQLDVFDLPVDHSCTEVGQRLHEGLSV